MPRRNRTNLLVSFLKFFLGISKHRGWLIQQIVKLCAPMYVDEENIAFLDSDIIFIKKFGTDVFFKDNQLRLFRELAPRQSKWIDASQRILNIPNFASASLINYINPLVTWKRSTIIRLQNYIEKIHNQPWARVFLKEHIFSEYNTYGLFYDFILNNHSQIADSKILTYNVWNKGDDASLLSDIDLIKEKYIGLLLQSNIDTELDLYGQYINHFLACASEPLA